MHVYYDLKPECTVLLGILNAVKKIRVPRQFNVLDLELLNYNMYWILKYKVSGVTHIIRFGNDIYVLNALNVVDRYCRNTSRFSENTLLYKYGLQLDLRYWLITQCI